MNRLTPVLLLAAGLFAGCAGYNHTLFVTKSNAGLDFDAKPPTAEISIARKEAVIAPGFEGGQTPPVLASFKPRVGLDGGFANFFVGVDQTFAGGDAAVAMSRLYDSKETPTDIAAYDSRLPLTQPPKYRNIFQRVAGAGETRPFIFGTDTMLGLKVAWSGVGGQFPDTVKAGFNRKEFAWAPVTLITEPNDAGSATNYSAKMPSFLATIDSQNTAGVDRAGIEALQYFATGDAATLLAMQPEVRTAMIQRLDPNAGKIAARVKQKHSDADRLAAYAAPAGTVERSRLETIVKNTTLAGNQNWLNAWTGKPKAEFAAALKEDYYPFIPGMTKNLPGD